MVWATPGQFDAGFASLATFITGLVAVRGLSVGGLAAYALLTAAYRVMNQFPAGLIFSPSQIIAIDLPRSQRLGSLVHSVPRGTWLSVVSSLAVPLGALIVAGDVSREELLALSVTASLLAMASPIQDHVRAVLHLSDVSKVAAVMSATNFVVTGLSLIFVFSSISWAVFGSLFIGNCLSLLIGAAWILRLRSSIPPKPSFRHLFSLGGWLLATDLGKTGIRYGVTALIGFFAGVVALGYIEAARVVVQPVRVFSQGIMTQVGPWLTEAGSRRDASLARRWSRRFALLVGLATVPYFVLVAQPWPLNPFAVLVPRAYEVPGLVAATLLVLVPFVFAESLRFQLLGARKQKILTLIALLAGIVELSVAPFGSVFGAYAAPLSAGAGLLLTIPWFARILRHVYRRPEARLDT